MPNGTPKSGCSPIDAPMLAIRLSEFASTGAEEMSRFHALSAGNGTAPFSRAPTPSSAVAIEPKYKPEEGGGGGGAGGVGAGEGDGDGGRGAGVGAGVGIGVGVGVGAGVGPGPGAGDGALPPSCPPHPINAANTPAPVAKNSWRRFGVMQRVY